MPNTKKKKVRQTLGYFDCLNGELNGPKGRPFFRVRLDKEWVERLRHALRDCAARGGRCWFTLTSTSEKPERLRLTEKQTPAYELNAESIYVRGEAVRISGDKGSCNIDFSGQVGASLLEERLETAQTRMRRFLDIRVPSRARNLIEFITDTELEAMPSPEHEKLAIASGLAAAEVLGAEDFSDWEEAGV